MLTINILFIQRIYDDYIANILDFKRLSFTNLRYKIQYATIVTTCSKKRKSYVYCIHDFEIHFMYGIVRFVRWKYSWITLNHLEIFQWKFPWNMSRRFSEIKKFFRKCAVGTLHRDCVHTWLECYATASEEYTVIIIDCDCCWATSFKHFF